MKRILLIEDAVECQLVVKNTLSGRYHLTCAGTGAEASEALHTTSFDLVLLDVVLPDVDGLRICAELAQTDATRSIPVIILTSRSDLKDKLVAFSIGADDYIIKPFEPLELRARIENRLRKMEQQQESQEFLRRGDLVLQLPFLRAASVEGMSETDLGLTPTEFRLLYYLCRHEGRIFSREQLLDAIWGEKLNVMERTIDTHVYTLRRKLSDRARYIQSVPGAGYRFRIA